MKEKKHIHPIPDPTKYNQGVMFDAPCILLKKIGCLRMSTKFWMQSPNIVLVEHFQGVTGDQFLILKKVERAKS